MGRTPLVSELKARREMLGWSLKQVCEHLDLDEHFLDGWERGVGSPQLETLDGWAEALGLRLSLTPAAEQQQQALPRRGLRVDWTQRCVTVDGSPVRLTPMEWKALERLAAAPGELVTHQALFRHLYGEDRPYSTQSTAIRVLITKLRRLLPLRIDAQWGRGYVVGEIEASSACGAGSGSGNVGGSPAAAPVPQRLPKSPSPAKTAANSRCEQAHRNAAPGLMQRLIEHAEPAIQRPPVAATATAAVPVRFQPQRSEELQVIERFLAERGATRCPDVATIERSPLPTLVWDKVKRKWVRPAAAAAARVM